MCAGHAAAVPQGTLFVLAKEVEPKEQLLAALAQRRARNDDDIQQLAEQLGTADGGEAAPAASPVAVGTWRLVWTQQGPTANPLQKALAGQARNRTWGFTCRHDVVCVCMLLTSPFRAQSRTSGAAL